MKTIATASLVALSLVFGSAMAQDEKAAPKPAGSSELKDLKAKASYALGQNIGKNLKAQSIELDPQTVAKGMADALSGAKGLLTDEEAEAAMEAFQKEILAKKAEAGKKVGDEYLTKNKAKAGVTTTKTGLQYEVLKEGSGAKPKSTDTVKAHYEGKLTNGTVFDSSYKRGEPSSFALDQVIAGWTEGLQLMKVGSKYRFTIPSNLGYGERGSPPKIPPGSVLVFEVELLGVE